MMRYLLVILPFISLLFGSLFEKKTKKGVLFVFVCDHLLVFFFLGLNLLVMDGILGAVTTAENGPMALELLGLASDEQSSKRGCVSSSSFEE